MDALVFNNGKAASSPAELLAVVEQLDPAVFAEHVNTKKNDIATWIDSQLDEKQLVAQLRTTTDQKKTVEILRKAIAPTSVQKASQFLETGHQKEFLFGLMMGVILGLILFRILQVLI
jgi:hypothetical protein